MSPLHDFGPKKDLCLQHCKRGLFKLVSFTASCQFAPRTYYVRRIMCSTTFYPSCIVLLYSTLGTNILCYEYAFHFPWSYSIGQGGQIFAAMYFIYFSIRYSDLCL